GTFLISAHGYKSGAFLFSHCGEHLREEPRDLGFDFRPRLGVTLIARAFNLTAPFRVTVLLLRGIRGNWFRRHRPASIVVTSECPDVGFVVGEILDRRTWELHRKFLLEPFGIDVRYAEGDEVRRVRKDCGRRLATETVDCLCGDRENQIEF